MSATQAPPSYRPTQSTGLERGMVHDAPAASRSPAVRGARWFWSGPYRPGVKDPQSERALV
jgi:hypothetical protein